MYRLALTLDRLPFNLAKIFPMIDERAFLAQLASANTVGVSYGKFDDWIYSELSSGHPIDLCRYKWPIVVWDALISLITVVPQERMIRVKPSLLRSLMRELAEQA